MDAKMLFGLSIVLIAIGNFILNLLRIAKLTKTTVVRGGESVEDIVLIASLVAAVGALIFLYTVTFHWVDVVKIVSFVFGG